MQTGNYIGIPEARGNVDVPEGMWIIRRAREWRKMEGR
jgi:hypothetical protein